VDGTYRGAEWTAWVKERYNIVLESVVHAGRPKRLRVRVYRHRWVVERTLAWLKPMSPIEQRYEELPTTSETFVYVAMTRFDAQRLAA